MRLLNNYFFTVMPCPWGTGKTWIMEAKVRALVEEIIAEGRNEKVVMIFFVGQEGSPDSLLPLQMKDRLKDLKDDNGKPLVEVKTIKMERDKTCGLEEIGKGFDYVMMSSWSEENFNFMMEFLSK